MERIELALGRTFFADAGELRVEDRGTRWSGLFVCVLMMAAGYCGFLHGVGTDAWYIVPGLLCAALGFLICVRLLAGAWMQQTLECTRQQVTLRRYHFGRAAGVDHMSFGSLAQVRREVVTGTKYGPVHGMVFTDEDGNTLETLRSMPAWEMQGLLLRLEKLKYPVVLDDSTPRDAQLGDVRPRGLLRWL